MPKLLAASKLSPAIPTKKTKKKKKKRRKRKRRRGEKIDRGTWKQFYSLATVNSARATNQEPRFSLTTFLPYLGFPRKWHYWAKHFLWKTFNFLVSRVLYYTGCPLIVPRRCVCSHSCNLSRQFLTRIFVHVLRKNLRIEQVREIAGLRI